MPGKVTEWPPVGELGGVGLFAVVMFVALGVVIWLGLRKPLVVTLVCMFASAWLMRMEIASRMFSTGTVQLYTRTNNQLLYCGLIICALVAHLISLRMAEQPVEAKAEAEVEAGTVEPPGRTTGRFPHPQAAVIGAFCGLLMLFGSVSSAMSDRYMPAKENTYRILPWVSHTVQKLDGTCPKFAPEGKCSKDGDQSWLGMIQ